MSEPCGDDENRQLGPRLPLVCLTVKAFLYQFPPTANYRKQILSKPKIHQRGRVKTDLDNRFSLRLLEAH